MASADITQLLSRWRGGESGAGDALYAALYSEMRRMAGRELGRLGPGVTMSATDLAHEAYLKLINQKQVRWEDRVHFMAVAATAMRHILINHGERRRARKRGGDWQRVTFDKAELVADQSANSMLALDEALRQLEGLDPRLGKVVECRFFGGMTEKEIGAVLGVDERTVRRDWVKARALLADALGDADLDPPTPGGR